MLGSGLIVLTWMARSKFMEKHLNRVMSWALKKYTNLDVRDYVSLLQLQNGYAVTEMLVKQGDWLEGKTLAKAALAHEGVLILAIFRNDGEYLGAPLASDRIDAGDILVLYGQIDGLRELDQRVAHNGDMAHRRAVENYSSRVRR